MHFNDGWGGGALGALRCEVQGGFITGTTKVADGQWDHLGITFNGGGTSDVKMYVDGTLDSPSNIGDRALNTDNTTNRLAIGAFANNGLGHNLDDVNNANPDSPWIGNVWTFSTGPFLVVDDFESYNDIGPPAPASHRIFEAWIDGFGTTKNGALIGKDFPPYAERNIVHSGSQSMPYLYDNSVKTSEATMTLVWPRDWTEWVIDLQIFADQGVNLANVNT